MILTQNQLALENSLRRILPADIVSLWIPDGYNRAKDLIRGNHGQCHGTHPNVPVLPNLINSAVSWVFGGDDYIKGTMKVLSTSYAMGFWMNASEARNTMYDNIVNIGPNTAGENTLQKYQYTGDSAIVDFEIYSGGKVTIEVPGVFDNTWHYIVYQNDGTVNGAKVFKDNVLIGSVTQSEAYAMTEYVFGARVASYTSLGTGYIALPFIANKAWSQQQVENFYLATKGLFAPRS